MIQNLPGVVLSELYFIIKMRNIIPIHSNVSVFKVMERSLLISLNVIQFHRLLVFNLESFYLLVQIVVLRIHIHPSLPWDADLHGLSWEFPCPLVCSEEATGTQKGNNRLKEREERKIRHFHASSNWETTDWLHLSPGGHLLPPSSLSLHY